MTSISSARLAAFASALALLVSTPLFAQQSERHFGLDPYKPSDAKILREQGPTITTQLSPEELSKLDPYNPTDAALMRQAGGAIPVCCLSVFAPIGSGVGVSGNVVPMLYVPRASAAREAGRNTVWVCSGTQCGTEDVRTHRFSRPPVDADGLSIFGAGQRQR